jgi:hypothetical protein
MNAARHHSGAGSVYGKDAANALRGTAEEER